MVKSWLLVEGCPRSGTSCLSSLLNTHKDIHVKNEINFIKIPDRDIERYLIHNKIIKTNLDVTYLGDKLPCYFMYNLKDIKNKMSNVKIIHISRNPFRTINSMILRRNRARKGKDKAWNPLLTIDDSCNLWVDAWNKAIERNNDVSFLHIKYEDLLKEPKIVSARISAFLGVENSFKINRLKAERKKIIFTKKQLDKIQSLMGNIIHDWDEDLEDLEKKYSHINNKLWWKFTYKLKEGIFRIISPVKKRKVKNKR